MALVLDITLVADRYDAGGGLDPRETEWPPHPARVFSAFRSVADDDGDVEALRVLERLPAPMVAASAPDDVRASRRAGYVVLNKTERAGGNLTHPGRSSGLRQRRSVYPRSPRVVMTWPDTVPGEVAERIDAMSRRVPYLGRSTSAVIMEARVVDEPPITAPGLETLRPCAAAEAELYLRAPYAGFTDELDELHEAGLSAWQATDGGRAVQGYRADRAVVSEEPTAISPYRDLVVLRFEGFAPQGRLLTAFTGALRRHVLAADDLPPTVHGHGADGVPHVAFLALPVVGHPHADGHLVALGLAIPGLADRDRRALLRRVLGDEPGVVELEVPRVGRVRLVHRPNEERPRSAVASQWSRPSTTWVSATPVVLDRYPKNGDVAGEVRRSCVTAGLPQPTHVSVSRQPLAEGAVAMRPHDLPKRAQGRIFCHARLRFGVDVTGPVLVGAGRYLGAGLFWPERAFRGDSGVAEG